MEFELLLLQLADYVFSGDFENSLLTAQAIGMTKNIDIDQKSRVREIAIGMFSDGETAFSKEEVKQILDALGTILTEAYKALILFAAEKIDGMSSEEFKATEAYQYINQEDPQFESETEKFTFVQTLSMAAIITRDRELISFMMEKITELGA